VSDSNNRLNRTGKLRLPVNLKKGENKMELVKPSVGILSIMEGGRALNLIERAGRVCYKSEAVITEDSNLEFVRKIKENGHHSVLEHSAMTVHFVCDRGVSHELVRHRLAAFSQESTRYCNYKGGVTFVIPPWLAFPEGEYDSIKQVPLGLRGAEWFLLMLKAEKTYKQLLRVDWSAQQARSVLPNSLKTEITVTANFREWLHIFNLRCAKSAHPQMREVMIPLRDMARKAVPIVFGDPA
jgi:thymidylate synthase (FAD)